MGVLRDNLEFHAVHRVGVKRQVGEYDHPNGPKQYNGQIIMRFVNQQDRDRVWMNKEKIKNSKNYSSAFFTQDFPKEIADERAKLRKIAKNAKDNNIQVEIRKNKSLGGFHLARQNLKGPTGLGLMHVVIIRQWLATKAILS